jgi:hypothetical protein
MIKLIHQKIKTASREYPEAVSFKIIEIGKIYKIK